MSNLTAFLVEHGSLLLTGATLLMVIGALCMACQRSPASRQRTGELTVLAVLVWTVLACLPLPRFALDDVWPNAMTRFSRSFESEAQQTQLQRAERPQSVVPQMDIADNVEVAAEYVEIQFGHTSPVDSGFESTIIFDARQSNEEDRELVGTSVEVPINFDESPDSSLYAMPVIIDNAAESSPALSSIESPVPDDVAAAPAAAKSFLTSLSEHPWVGRERIASVYLIGASLSLAWLILGRLLLARIVRAGRPPEAWLRDLYEALRLPQRAPRLIISDRASYAMTFGLWRPTIVLPADICRPERCEQLKHVLRHELVHVERRDALGQFVLNLAFPLLWLHPLYYWLRVQTLLAAELLADDQAAGQSTRTSYAEQLVALVRESRALPSPSFGVLRTFHFPSRFYRRMDMLLRRETSLPIRCSAPARYVGLTVFFIAVGILSCLLGVEPLQADPADDEPAAEAAEETAASNDETPSETEKADPSEKASDEAVGSEAAPKTGADEVALPAASAKDDVKADDVAAPAEFRLRKKRKPFSLTTKEKKKTVTVKAEDDRVIITSPDKTSKISGSQINLDAAAEEGGQPSSRNEIKELREQLRLLQAELKRLSTLHSAQDAKPNSARKSNVRRNWYGVQEQPPSTNVAVPGEESSRDGNSSDPSWTIVPSRRPAGRSGGSRRRSATYESTPGPSVGPAGTPSLSALPETTPKATTSNVDSPDSNLQPPGQPDAFSQPSSDGTPPKKSAAPTSLTGLAGPPSVPVKYPERTKQSVDEPAPSGDYYYYGYRKQKPEASRQQARTPVYSTQVGSQLDLIRLAMAYHDAMTTVKQIERAISPLKAPAANNGIYAMAQHQLAEKTLELEAAKSKQDFYRRIAKAALKAANTERRIHDEDLKRAETLHRQGVATSHSVTSATLQVARVQAQIEILQEVLR